MKTKKTKPKRGGARPGAGRKPGVRTAGTVKLLVSPLATTATRLRARARREDKTLGQILDELL